MGSTSTQATQTVQANGTESAAIQHRVEDGVGILTWHDTTRPMNVMSEAVLMAFESSLNTLLADPSVKGVVITSGRKEFVVGADISLLVNLREAPADKAFADIRRLQNAFRAMETQPKPVAAAITGDALGGGLELAMACHRRFVADDASIKLGLPEVMLGVLPGAGGTQRLPRLVGAQEALKLATAGKTVNPAKAVKLGLVDEVVPAGELLQRACAWVRSFNGKAVQPWDKPGFQVPHTRYMDDMWLQTFGAGSALLRKETRGKYPAPQAIMSCIYQGVQLGMDAALKHEARKFVTLLKGPVSRAMTRTLWFGRNRANKLEKRPAAVPKTVFAQVGVLGAGVMGAGIAIVTAEAGIRCVLVDVSAEAAARGHAYARDYWQRQVDKGRLAAARKEELLSLIVPTADYAQLAGSQLVIEAVFEDRALKARVTRMAEDVIGATGVFGTNTSTLPITGLAEASQRPERFIGIHFFSPVEKMPLVEIIRGKATGDAATAVAMDYVAAIRKTPIVVNDARGFYTSRVFGTYAREAFEMLQEGIAPALIENLGRRTGMPMGPFELTDMIGVDTAQRIGATTALEVGWDTLVKKGENPKNLELLDWIVLENGRTGQKVGKGFHDYGPDRKPTGLWPELARRYARNRPTPDAAEQALLERRFLHIQALEAVRCMEEGVVMAADDADVGSIFGWGFAPWTGGVLSYIDGIGVARFLAECEALAAALGPRFEPPALLRRMAAAGERFYPVEPQ
jgi:3-hydroxyacyl-CoA dehydrogenase/enoyl-CoA hydratase/3-hydroxybutyryl-CoA epimerase